MNVVVTGGGGFIGSYVVKALAENDIHVICVDKAQIDSERKNVTLVKADVANLDALQEILLNYGASAVVHLVGLPHVEDCEKNPQLSFQLNTLSTQNVVEAIRRTDVPKLVFASTASVYGYQTKVRVDEKEPPKPNTIYGFHKLISEQIIRSYQERYGIKALVFRLFNVYGGDPAHGKEVISIFIRNIRDGKPLVVSSPYKFRDFIHIEDVARAVVCACTNNTSNEIVNIGTGIKITLGQLAEIVKGVVPNVVVDENEASDDRTGICADITLAKKLFNFNPISPGEGIERHIERYIGEPA